MIYYLGFMLSFILIIWGALMMSHHFSKPIKLKFFIGLNMYGLGFMLLGMCVIRPYYMMKGAEMCIDVIREHYQDKSIPEPIEEKNTIFYEI